MRIAEPTTLITDYVLAALDAALGARLFARSEGQVSVRLWASGFLANAAGALLGGTFHGFGPYLGSGIDHILWKGTLVTIGLSAFFALSGTVVATLRPPWRHVLLAAAGAELALFLAWMTTHDDFRFVVYDFVLSFIVVAVLQLARRREPGAGSAAAGVVVSLAGAAVQRSGFKLHESFNHNDLFHVVSMAAAWLLYRGARTMRDR